MRFPVSAASLLLAWLAAATFLPSAHAQDDDRTFYTRPTPSRKDEPLVDISVFCPGVVIDLRYASTRNLTGKPIYPEGSAAWIRRGVADQINAAQAYLKERGFGLKVWDAYRPPWAQKVLWDAVRNPHFVVEPTALGSMHAWGVAVDVTLVDAYGRQVKMPTDFDSFTPEARYDYRGKDPTIAYNLSVLKKAMAQAGFRHIRDEWWHYSSKDSNEYGPLTTSLKSKQPKPVAVVEKKPALKPQPLAAAKPKPTPKPETPKKPETKVVSAKAKPTPKPVVVVKTPPAKPAKPQKIAAAATPKPTKTKVIRVAVAPRPPKPAKVKVVAAPKPTPTPKTKVAAVAQKPSKTTQPKPDKSKPEKRRVVRTLFPLRPGEQL